MKILSRKTLEQVIVPETPKIWLKEVFFRMKDEQDISLG